MDIVFFIAYGSFLSPLLTLIVSLRLKETTYDIRLIQLLMAVSFLVDLGSLLLGQQGINTYPLGNAFFLIQSIIFALIFGDVLKIKTVSYIIAATYGVIFGVNFFFIQGPFILNSYSHSVSSVIFIFLSLIYFRHLLIKLPVAYVERMPMIWINISVLIYYSGNLFLFILNNYFTNGDDGNQRVMWIIHNLLNIVKNLLFLIAIWQNLRKTNSSYS